MCHHVLRCMSSHETLGGLVTYIYLDVSVIHYPQAMPFFGKVHKLRISILLRKVSFLNCPQFTIIPPF